MITLGSTRAIELFDDVQNKIAFNVKELLDKIEEGVELVCDGNTVFILSTEYPDFLCVLNTVLRIFNEKCFDKSNIEVMPGISSLQLVAAKPYSQRNKN